MSSFGGGILGLAVSTKDVMGALAVLIAIAAYGIYVWKTLRGDARPHPLSWLIFGVLTGTGYLVQLDQKAGPGSWVMAVTTLVCLMLCVMSFWRGERTFPWYEWAFLGAAIVVFVFYLWSRNPEPIGAVGGVTPRDLLIRHAPAISSTLAAFVNVLGFGPTVTKAWLRPHSDSVSIFVLNSLKFVPSFFALDSISVATCVFPATLVVANAGVALIIYLRRQQVS
ncbi:MAG: hypothetical protein WBQ24_08770 [Xanthobacteraceae bacterium]